MDFQNEMFPFNNFKVGQLRAPFCEVNTSPGKADMWTHYRRRELKRIFPFRVDPAGFIVDPIIALIVVHNSGHISKHLSPVLPWHSRINGQFDLQSRGPTSRAKGVLETSVSTNR